MGDSAPRHLAEPPAPQRRWWLWAGAGVASLLLVATVVWVTTPGRPERAANQPPADLSAAPSPAAGGLPTTTGAVATTIAQASDDGPKNLLANASFEDGSLGWQPLGGARLTKTTEAREGGYSLRISAGPSAGGPVGITVPDVTLTKLNGRYHTNAWVRPSSPNTTVTIGLREYRGGQPVPGSNTLGWTVERTGWRKFGAIHVASQSGSQLALEIMARDLPPGGYLDIDEVVLHLLLGR
jgi:Carbohydrate binding domain